MVIILYLKHINIIIMSLMCYYYRGLLALWEYMETQMKIDPRPVWAGIQDVVIKTILRYIPIIIIS